MILILKIGFLLIFSSVFLFRLHLTLAPLQGIARDIRKRRLNSPCISPYLGFRARSDCRRERNNLGGNERAEPPRCMARGLVEWWMYIPVSFTSYPIRWQVRPVGLSNTSRQIYSRKNPAFFIFFSLHNNIKFASLFLFNSIDQMIQPFPF